VQYVASIDVGTSGIKGALVDEDCGIVRKYQRELPAITSGAFHEHDPRLAYETFLEVVRELVKGYGNKIAALSFDTYNHSVILLDSNEAPLTNILTGLDLRAGNYVKAWSDIVDPYEIYSATGCPPLFVYVPPRMLWFKRERPNIFKRARKILGIKDYLMMRIVGEPYADYGVASGNGVLDLRSLRYSDVVLSSLGISEDSLATLVEGGKLLDSLPGKWLKEVGITSERVPLVPSTFDGAAQSFGLASILPRAAVNLGTTAVVRTLSEIPVVDKKSDMRYFCYYAANKLYAIGGSSSNCGLVLRWFGDSFCGIEPTISSISGAEIHELLDDAAARVPSGAAGLIFLPFIWGERFPFRDQHASGVVFGLRPHHTRGHMIRALMEGIAFTLRAIFESMAENDVTVSEIYLAGGGSRSSLWPQILADVLNVHVKKVNISEDATCLGNAALALGAMFSRDIEQCVSGVVREERISAGIQENIGIYERNYRLYEALYVALKDLFARSASSSNVDKWIERLPY